MDEQNTQNNTTPEFSEDEMKMPESPIAEHGAEKTSWSSGLLPILLSLLFVIVLIGAAYLLWGEKIISDLMNTSEPTQGEAPMPVEQTDSPSEAATTTPPQTNENELSTLADKLEETDFSEFDAELNAIEEELDAALEE